MALHRPAVARAQATLTGARATTVHVGSHTLFTDETPPLGGAATGPSPEETLLAALGACTAMALRRFSERKQWAIGTIHVDLELARDAEGEHIDRQIRVAAALSPAQVQWLVEAAEESAVTRTLKRGLPIHTRIVGGSGG